MRLDDIEKAAALQARLSQLQSISMELRTATHVILDVRKATDHLDMRKPAEALGESQSRSQARASMKPNDFLDFTRVQIDLVKADMRRLGVVFAEDALPAPAPIPKGSNYVPGSDIQTDPF